MNGAHGKTFSKECREIHLSVWLVLSTTDKNMKDCLEQVTIVAGRRFLSVKEKAVHESSPPLQRGEQSALIVAPTVFTR